MKFPYNAPARIRVRRMNALERLERDVKAGHRHHENAPYKAEMLLKKKAEMLVLKARLNGNRRYSYKDAEASLTT